eukprot:COSAG02_NODE_2024_length_10084_cov_130.539509_5_plen_74_part_00
MSRRIVIFGRLGFTRHVRWAGCEAKDDLWYEREELCKGVASSVEASDEHCDGEVAPNGKGGRRRRFVAVVAGA